MGLLENHQRVVWARMGEGRMLSLDVFRGITITGMILVNNPGSWAHVYPPLLHARWHGWTPTDLIFPFFLFIVGVSLHLSTAGKLARGADRLTLLQAGLVRSAKLYGLGLFLALFFYDFTSADYSWIQTQLMDIRLLGVLQRIAFVFVISLGIVLAFGRIGRVLWLVGLLVLYGTVMLYMPYPQPDGRMAAGLFEYGNNLAAYVDHHILGVHLYYQQAEPYRFDPEGLLSTLPAVSTCLLGYGASEFLQRSGSILTKIAGLIVAGLILTAAGTWLDGIIPINKALWTPSYVLLTAGIACLVLAVCLLLLDVAKIRGWSTPFLVFGANAIAFFMLSGIVGRLLIMIPVGDTFLKEWIFQNIYFPAIGAVTGSLAFALTFLILSYGVMFWMYRRGIFWKV